jgi:hypothetical protein
MRYAEWWLAGTINKNTFRSQKYPLDLPCPFLTAHDMSGIVCPKWAQKCTEILQTANTKWYPVLPFRRYIIRIPPGLHAIAVVRMASNNCSGEYFVSTPPLHMPKLSPTNYYIPPIPSPLRIIYVVSKFIPVSSRSEKWVRDVSNHVSVIMRMRWHSLYTRLQDEAWGWQWA